MPIHKHGNQCLWAQTHCTLNRSLWYFSIRFSSSLCTGLTLKTHKLYHPFPPVERFPWSGTWFFIYIIFLCCVWPIVSLFDLQSMLVIRLLIILLKVSPSIFFYFASSLKLFERGFRYLIKPVNTGLGGCVSKLGL